MKTITLPARELTPDHPASSTDLIKSILPGSSQLQQTANEADTLFVPDWFPLHPARRLVVLVPSDEIDEQALAYRVWQLADCSGLSVLFVTLVSDEALISYHRRRLVGLAAMTKFTHIHTDTSIQTHKKWPSSLTNVLQTGDLLVCLAENRSPGLFHRKALGERLSTNLGLPVYVLGNMQVKPAHTSRHWLKDVFAWTTALALMGGFFYLQFEIDRYFPQWPATILIFLSVLVEIYCLGKINNWTR